METQKNATSAARGALLVVYLTAIILMVYALFGPVEADGQASLVAIAMSLFVIGAMLPANVLKK